MPLRITGNCDCDDDCSNDDGDNVGSNSDSDNDNSDSYDSSYGDVLTVTEAISAAVLAIAMVKLFKILHMLVLSHYTRL